MKELTISITIDDFTAQDYYRTVYQGAELFTRYHKEHTKDPNAEVSPWSNNSRAVKFNLMLNVPQMLKKVIGTDCIAVLENQELTWHGKEKFVISSAPTLNFPGSSKFTTKGHTTVTTVNGRTCQVDAMIVCNAAMPWPMQSTVEAAMASEATAGISKFLNFCKQVCEESRAVSKAAPAPVVEVVEVEAVGAADSEESSEEMFYDAWDTLDEAGLQVQGPGVSVAKRQGTQVGRPVPPAAAGSHDMLLLASLRELQLSSHATAQALADVAQQLKAMNENVAAIRAAVAGGGSWQSSSRGSWRSGYTVGLMFLAGASAASMVYLRSRQRGGLQ